MSFLLNRHPSRFLFLSLSLSLAAMSSSCGKDTPKQSVVAKNSLSEYQKASCQYGFDEGGQVDAQVALTPEIKTVYFGKQLDYAPFRAVWKSSIHSTIDFIKTWKVTPYQIPNTVSDCNPFSSLEVAPDDFRKIWDDASTTVDKKKGTITGLYIPQRSPRVASSVDTAEIGVRKDANRWIIVHEFMHHLFHLQIQKPGDNPDAVKDEADAAFNDLDSTSDSFNKLQSDTNLEAVGKAYLVAYDKAKALLLEFPLEEVTIESTLQTELANQDLAYAPLLKESSDSYINNSAKTSRTLLSKLTSLGNQIITNANKLTGHADLVAKLNASIKDQADFTGQIDAVVNAITAQPDTGVNSSFLMGDSAGSAGDAPEPCSHEKGADELISKAGGILDRITAQ